MSGFVGLYRAEAGADRAAMQADLGRMLAAIAHRGPDGEGRWSDGPVGLGYRHLSVTPESLHERQPCAGPDGVIAVCDGRLDNRAELRHLLGASEAPSPEAPDVEWLLLAYRRWGMACAARLVGEFAFAMWDGRNQRLFCARDAMGVRPFYYHWDGRCLAFASSIRALLELPDVPRRVNQQMIAAEILSDFRFDYRDPDATFFEGIRQLQPAHTLTVERGRMQAARYWDPIAIAMTEPSAGDLDAHLERFREAFREAVRCRLRSRLPVAVALSGGIDSTLVTATAETLRREEPGLPDLRAFTLLFGGMHDEELEAIARLRQWYATPVQFLKPDPRPAALFERYICDTEVPHYHGFCNHLALYRMLKEQGHQVILTGYGSDELIATCESGWLSDLLRQGRIIMLGRELLRRAWAGRDAPHAVALDFLREQVPPALRCRLRALRGLHVPAWVNRSFAEDQRMSSLQPVNGLPSRLTHCNHASLKALTAPALALSLAQADDVAAQHGLEWRFPFLDRRVIECFLSVPAHVKRRAGYRKGFPQRALRRETQDVVRPRMGAVECIGVETAPAERALEAQRFTAHLEGAGPLIFRFLDRGKILRLAQAYAQGRLDVRTPIWKMSGVAHWLQIYFSNTTTGQDTMVSTQGGVT